MVCDLFCGNVAWTFLALFLEHGGLVRVQQYVTFTQAFLAKIGDVSECFHCFHLFFNFDFRNTVAVNTVRFKLLNKI